mgnify:CR=1 FL=1
MQMETIVTQPNRRKRLREMGILAFWWGLPFAVGGILHLALPRGFIFVADDALSWRIGLTVVAILVGYFGVGATMFRTIELSTRELPLTIVVFMGTSLMIVAQFALLGYLPCDLVVASSMDAKQAAYAPTGFGLFQTLYFSTVTFTSVGYGDLIPRAGAGKALAMTEALMGSAHGVLFVLVHLRGGTWSAESIAHGTPAAGSKREAEAAMVRENQPDIPS